MWRLPRPRRTVPRRTTHSGFQTSRDAIIMLVRKKPWDYVNDNIISTSKCCDHALICFMAQCVCDSLTEWKTSFTSINRFYVVFPTKFHYYVLKEIFSKTHTLSAGFPLLAHCLTPMTSEMYWWYFFNQDVKICQSLRCRQHRDYVKIVPHTQGSQTEVISNTKKTERIAF